MPKPEGSTEILDPRVKRTRSLLRQALYKVLQEKGFEEISVQDITEAATVNRATFYDHFADKFALLEDMVASDFHGLLAKRQIQFDGTCGSGLKAIVLALCDYLTGIQGRDCERQSQPHMEIAVLAVLRRTLVDGLRERNEPCEPSAEMIGATVSWAAYGAVREWIHTPNRSASEQIAETVAKLVSPILHAAQS